MSSNYIRLFLSMILNRRKTIHRFCQNLNTMSGFSLTHNGWIRQYIDLRYVSRLYIVAESDST